MSSNRWKLSPDPRSRLIPYCHRRREHSYTKKRAGAPWEVSDPDPMTRWNCTAIGSDTQPQLAPGKNFTPLHL